MMQFLKYLSVLHLKVFILSPCSESGQISVDQPHYFRHRNEKSFLIIPVYKSIRGCKYNVSTFPQRLKRFGSFITSLNSTIVVISEFLNAWTVEREGLHGEIQEAMVINLINQVNEKLVKMACNYIFI